MIYATQGVGGRAPPTGCTVPISVSFNEQIDLSASERNVPGKKTNLLEYEIICPAALGPAEIPAMSVHVRASLPMAR